MRRDTPAAALRDFLGAEGETQQHFADRIGTTRYSINQLVKGRRRVTVPMAFMLALGTRTSAAFWLDLQRNDDYRVHLLGR